MSAAKAGDAPTKDEKIAAIHKDVQKKIVSVRPGAGCQLPLHWGVVQIAQQWTAIMCF